MRVKLPVARLAITLALAGCGSIPQTASRSVFQAQQPPPAQEAQPATAQPGMALTAEEAQAFVLPQPPLHPLLIARIYDGLGIRFPELADRLRVARERILGLNRLQLRALHAACYEAFKDKTLEALAGQWEGFLARPPELLAFVDTQLDKVEGKDVQATAQLARTLPGVFIALEKLPVKLGKAAGPQGETSGAPTGAELRGAVIRAMVAAMAERDPADKLALERLGQRLAALGTEDMRVIHADMWQAMKGETLARATERLTGWFDRPATFLAEMQQRVERVASMSARERADLLAFYPKALSTMEDIVLAEPATAAVAPKPAEPRMPGDMMGMPGGMMGMPGGMMGMPGGMMGMPGDVKGMPGSMMGGSPSCPMMRKPDKAPGA